MRRKFHQFAASLVVLFAVSSLSAAMAENYTIDAAHSAVNFKISHLGLSWVHGRFDEVAGRFTVDAAEPASSSFAMTIEAKSVDTNNQKRDEHLRSPDFFDVKQFPSITFTSTAVKPTKGGYEVRGDLTMHGVTRPMTFNLVGGRKADFPKGVHRTGFSTELFVKRSDFGITKFADALGDKVYIEISFEGTRK